MNDNFSQNKFASQMDKSETPYFISLDPATEKSCSVMVLFHQIKGRVEIVMMKKVLSNKQVDKELKCYM